jgi:hypothetical protein
MKAKSKQAAIATATHAMGYAHIPILTIEDFAKDVMGRINFAAIGSHLIVSLLADKSRDSLAEAADALAEFKHPAIPFLRQAADALDCAEKVADMASETNADKADKTLARAILTFAVSARTALDSAEKLLDS